MHDGFAPLRGVRRADAVIVGGGLTGLMTAAALCDAGLRVIVLDTDEPGNGASKLCSGAATLLAAPVYARIVSAHGMDAARQHVDALRSVQAALPELLTGLTAYREAESYVYAFLPRDLPTLEEQHRLCTELGLPVSYAQDAGGCPFPVELSLLLSGQLMVDVPELLTALIRQIRRHRGLVYGHSRAVSWEPGRVCTDAGCAEGPLMLLCAGKPLGDARSRTLALLESRTLVRCRLTSQVPLHSLQQSVRPDGLSLRPLPGGAAASWCAGRSGTPEETERTALLTRVISGRMKDWEPGAFQYHTELWPLDGLPVIGAIGEYGGRVLCATGYSGHGLLGAALAAGILSRQALGRSRPSDQLYAPARPLPPALLKQHSRALRQMRRAAAWRMRAPCCPLCRCKLRYALPMERWACPVCGSAFGMLGRLLNGPAVEDAHISVLQRPDL